jgi:hypothetical protein
MENLSLVVPRILGIVAFGSVGLYYLLRAKHVSRNLYERTAAYKGVMRRLYPSDFYRSKLFIWILRAGGVLSLAISVLILLITIRW